MTFLYQASPALTLTQIPKLEVRQTSGKARSAWRLTITSCEWNTVASNNSAVLLADRTTHAWCCHLWARLSVTLRNDVHIRLFSDFVNFQSPFVRAMCAALPILPVMVLRQYGTSHCKPLLFGFPCKRRYINVGTFNLYPLSYAI